MYNTAPNDSSAVNPVLSAPTANAVPMRVVQSAPPPLPPRPSGQVHRSVPGTNMACQYMNYGRYPMGGYNSPYGSYGAMSTMGYGNRFSYGYPGMMNDADNAFIRMAEESSRPAFQSIESMVSAFGSISMMLESTYHAVHSSYRAVLGVVDHFSRLRNHLTQVFSTLALIRTLQWLIQRVLYFLNLRKTNPSAEAAWSAATNTALKSEGFTRADFSATSHWPIFMFLTLIFGAPWLIFRIFSKMASTRILEEKTQLASGAVSNEDRVVALYDFKAVQPGDLTIRRGQILHLAPKSQQPTTGSWALAIAENKSSGLVPTNYLGRLRKKASTTKVPTNPEVPPTK